MCGLAGYYGPEDIPAHRVGRCLGLMHHRGPDARGDYRHQTPTGHHLLLLHTRLAIIDLDPRANQPARHGSLVMAYNGEVYNYPELKQELAGRGQTFRTGSDTEVLLRLLALDGPDGLDRAEGMWALALFDEDSGQLFLCRDRFGEKPLYCYREGGGLYFGSEVKFIAALLGRSLSVDHEQVRRFLALGYRVLYKSNRTFFTGLDEVAPGSWLAVSGPGSEESGRYWRPTAVPEPGMDLAAAAAGAREHLIRAVGWRLRSDVPLAFCLSGGVDSNTLVALARRVFDYPAVGYTIANVDGRYQEKNQVEASVRALNLRHIWVALDRQGFPERLRELILAHDAPLYTITWYAHWHLMAAMAQDGYRIALSGTGADELFTGYYDHHLYYLLELGADSRLGTAARADWERFVRPQVRRPLFRDPEAFRDMVETHGPWAASGYDYRDFLTTSLVAAFPDKDFGLGLLRNRMLNELFCESVPVILHEDDLNAMAFSLENRSPFLDRALCEYSLTLPTEILMGQGWGKKVLREAVRGLVPDSIVDHRVKIGFNVPLSSLLDLSDPRTRDWIMTPGPILDLVRPDAVAALVASRELADHQSMFLFNYLGAKIFLEEYA